MTPQETAQTISALVALVAVIVGPLVSLRVAKRQIESAKLLADLQARANVLSKNRQEWINSLRAEVAGFITSVRMIIPLLFAQKDSLEMHKLLSQMQLQFSKVKLLINPSESDHAALILKMSEIVDKVLSLDKNTNALEDELVQLSQRILKREWERVKAFS